MPLESYIFNNSALEVRQEAHRIIAEVTSWSIEAAGSGIGPDRGFMNEEFQKGTSRFNLKGKELANGWKYLGRIGQYHLDLGFGVFCFWEVTSLSFFLGLEPI